MRKAIEIHPGAFHLPAFLAHDEQIRLFDRCEEIGRQAAGLYTPTVRYGARMRLRMVCLGLHWNVKTYKYEKV